jgi:DME family drug/metabolite transporter
MGKLISYPMGVIYVLCAGMFWSFIPVGVRGFDVANVWQILFFRSLGLLPLVFWLIYRETNGQAISGIRASGRWGIIGALGLVVAYAGGVAAVRMTTIANAAFLFATAPFIAAVLARIVLKERLRSFTIVALTLAVAGILVMVYDSVSRGNWLGDVLALLSAIGFSVFAIALRASKSTNSSLPVVFLGGMFAFVLAFAMCLFTGVGFEIPLMEILLALALGAFLLGIGMVLCTLGSRVVPAAELALLCMTEVVFAPVWAWLLLAEVPHASVFLGGSIVIFAIVLNAVTGMRNKPVTATF